jgi:hypothetical protein
MVKLNLKLSGSTLIETLVAMTLIFTAMTLSFSSIIKIKKSYNNDLRTAAFMIINKQLQIEESDTLLIGSKRLDYPSFSIRINKILYDNNSKFYVLTLKAITPDSLVLYETKKILKNPSNDKNIKSAHN